MAFNVLIPEFRVNAPAAAAGRKAGADPASSALYTLVCFLGLNLRGAFLAIVTVGVYGAWYVARVTRYVVGETSCQGTAFGFGGRGCRLFVILLLSLVLPVAVLATAAALFAVRPQHPCCLYSRPGLYWRSNGPGDCRYHPHN